MHFLPPPTPWIRQWSHSPDTTPLRVTGRSYLVTETKKHTGTLKKRLLLLIFTLILPPVLPNSYSEDPKISVVISLFGVPVPDLIVYIGARVQGWALFGEWLVLAEYKCWSTLFTVEVPTSSVHDMKEVFNDWFLMNRKLNMILTKQITRQALV